MRRALALLPLLLLGSCSPPAATAGPSLRYGLTLAPTGLDPHLNASSELTIPLGSVYDTLVFQDPETQEFVPGLASRWEISPDGRTYTFYLRQDVEFHDGTPFDANSVKVNLERVLDPENLSQKAASMLGPLESIAVRDPSTVVLQLSQPFAPLLDSLSQVYLGMASPKALAQWGGAEYQFHQVGTGPYRFVEYVPNDHLTLQANPDYDWAPSVYQHDQPYYRQVTFRFFEDPATRALALETGDVDVIGEMPPHDAERLVSSGKYQLQAVPIPGQPLQLFFNTTRSPTSDPSVRRALLLSVDRARLVRTVFGEHSSVAEGLLSAGTPGASPAVPAELFDPAEAASLLDAAGWRRGSDGLRQRDGVRLGITLIVPPWGSNPEAAQLVSAAWSELGAEVDLQVAPGFGPLKEAQAGGEYHVIGVNFFGSDPDLLRPFFSSDGLYNWTGWSDPDLDALLVAAAESTAPRSERLAMYSQVAEEVASQALVLPIRDYTNLVVHRRDLSNLSFSRQGWNPYLIDLRPAP
ncbi:MAG: ABC transporter substrate-binding protein [Anaerolineales bacterium]|nr:ABC transporter substrate-binding protein [Anaerolineales bacterium]